MSTIHKELVIPFSPELTTQVLTGFLREEIEHAGFHRAVLGLSGGVDSSVVAYLCMRALGPEQVWGILMPYRTSQPESKAHAGQVVQTLGIHSEHVEITPMVDAFFTTDPKASPLRRGNFMARQRMAILYDFSTQLEALVVGTSNKSELLLGYGTLYGDMASAINPLGDLYKTQVWALARYLGVPPAIVEKAPSADLWEGQTDEGELGFTYEEVDRLLYQFVDLRVSRAQLIEKGFTERLVDQVLHRVQSSQYKRRLPLIAKISERTIDRDFRYPRDWGK